MSAKKRRRAGVANPELAKAMVELRRSNAAGPHADKRTRRNRARAHRTRRAIKEQED